MPELDPLLLSRIQFAFTISFHILFPSFTIGLAAWLVVLEALWLAGRDPFAGGARLEWREPLLFRSGDGLAFESGRIGEVDACSFALAPPTVVRQPGANRGWYSCRRGRDESPHVAGFL